MLGLRNIGAVPLCADAQVRAFDERGEEGMASLRAQPFASPARVKVSVSLYVGVSTRGCAYSYTMRVCAYCVY